MSREHYEYLPQANEVLRNFGDLKDHADAYGLTDQGQLADLARRDMIRLYAVSAGSNGSSNDRRLACRQGVFRNTAYALICAGLGCIAVALNRQMPHTFDMATAWSLVHG